MSSVAESNSTTDHAPAATCLSTRSWMRVSVWATSSPCDTVAHPLTSSMNFRKGSASPSAHAAPLMEADRRRDLARAAQELLQRTRQTWAKAERSHVPESFLVEDHSICIHLALAAAWLAPSFFDEAKLAAGEQTTAFIRSGGRHRIAPSAPEPELLQPSHL